MNTIIKIKQKMDGIKFFLFFFLLIFFIAACEQKAVSKTEIIGGIEFTLIPEGEYTMGSTPESDPIREKNEVAHRVFVDSFWMGKFEVTQAQWRTLMGNNPSGFQKGDNNIIENTDNWPVERVSWDDVQEFIRRFNEKNQNANVRLPTEAEWEYAARSGIQAPFFFGNCISVDQANYNGNYPYKDCQKGINRGKPIPVGSLNQPNGFGLHDMFGNVREWCADYWGNYEEDPAFKQGGVIKNPKGAATGDNYGSRVLRGGSWGDSSWNSRSAKRSWEWPGVGSYMYGFRLVRSK